MKAFAIFAAFCIVGFAIGFHVGARTRENLPDATETEFSNGTFTLRVHVKRALKSGILSLFS